MWPTRRCNWTCTFTIPFRVALDTPSSPLATLAKSCNRRWPCLRNVPRILRHYHNQYLKDRLDRHLGTELLRYALNGTLPAEKPAAVQADLLKNLRRLLELEGFKCLGPQGVGASVVPLLVSKGAQQVAVGVRPALLEPAWTGHSLEVWPGASRPELLNEYILGRNLPDEHQMVRARILSAG